MNCNFCPEYLHFGRIVEYIEYSVDCRYWRRESSESFVYLPYRRCVYSDGSNSIIFDTPIELLKEYYV